MGARKKRTGTLAPEVPAASGRRLFLLLSAFLAGAIAMSLEIAAARLLAPYLGSSLQVWGALISVILGAMALGYAIGGRIADRATDDGPLFGAILASGVCQGGALFVAHPLLRRLAHWPDVAATLAGIVALFVLPTLLLATVGPCVIRLQAREQIGTTAGTVNALGAIGSIAGVLLTSFVLLPHAGTRATLQSLAAAALVLGAIGLFSRRASAGGLAVLTILALFFAPDREWPTRTLWTGESIYHVVQVVQLGKLRGLVLDEETSLHTAIDEAGGGTNGYWDDFAVGPLLSRGHRALVLGMGGGASIRALRAADPASVVDAVEIDPLVVRVAVEQFGVEPGRLLRLHVGDARRFLAASGDGYDVIQSDLFRGGPDIPSHLATVEFFELARRHLRPGGVLMVNVFDLAPGHPLLSSVSATLARAFPTVLVRSRNEMNHMLLAFAEPRDLPDVRAALANAPPAVSDVARALSASLRPSSHGPEAILLTDDRAPVEELTSRMMQAGRVAGTLRQP
jgi:predicted membrane-bound spermidine synthase